MSNSDDFILMFLIIAGIFIAITGIVFLDKAFPASQCQQIERGF